MTASKLTTVLIALLGLPLLAFSETADENADKQRVETEFKLITKKPIRSLPLFRIEQTSALSEHALLVKSGPSHSYLITLRNACPGLKMNEAISITNTAGEVEAGFDQIIVGREREHCFIDKIYPIATPKEIEEAAKSAH